MTPYVAMLSTAWEDHLEPRDQDAPTVVSTFAGCGGSSLGYSMAGYRELLAVEWDQHAVDMFRLNFPEVGVYHGDIADITIDDVLQRTNLNVGDLDVFDGSPPCQGFSTSGMRIMDDPRNHLFRHYVRLLNGLQPRVFVMENVSGMIKGKMKLIFAEILRELKACGYRVSARLLNASYFGIPQRRERMIFIGVRDDLGIDPSHPAATSRMTTLRKTVPGMTPETPGAPVAIEEPNYDLPALDDAYGRLWPQIRFGGDASDVIGKGFTSCVKPDPRKPCNTLQKTQTGRGFATMVHPYEQRPITIAEAKLIMSFPLEFRLEGAYSSQWARIGNAVPPLMMREIARHIRSTILQAVPHV